MVSLLLYNEKEKLRGVKHCPSQLRILQIIVIHTFDIHISKYFFSLLWPGTLFGSKAAIFLLAVGIH